MEKKTAFLYINFCFDTTEASAQIERWTIVYTRHSKSLTAMFFLTFQIAFDSADACADKKFFCAEAGSIGS